MYCIYRYIINGRKEYIVSYEAEGKRYIFNISKYLAIPLINLAFISAVISELLCIRRNKLPLGKYSLIPLNQKESIIHTIKENQKEKGITIYLDV